MRTPTWETSTGALAALLNSGAPLEKADAYTLTLPDGTVHRWSGSDVAMTFNSRTFSLGPGITRDRVRWVVGVEVSSIDVTLVDIIGTTVGGLNLTAAAARRAFKGARLLLERVFWGIGDAGPVGALHWFEGAVADVDADRRQVRLSVGSDIQLLDVAVPRDVYQPGCLNTLGDGLCGVDLTSLAITGATDSDSTADRTTFDHTLAQAAGWFDSGIITMTSGANTGVRRSVRRHLSGALQVLTPWPADIASGDTFSVRPGCDKRQTTCTSKFSNLARFRGMPFIPVAETVT